MLKFFTAFYALFSSKSHKTRKKEPLVVKSVPLKKRTPKRIVRKKRVSHGNTTTGDLPAGSIVNGEIIGSPIKKTAASKALLNSSNNIKAQRKDSDSDSDVVPGDLLALDLTKNPTILSAIESAQAKYKDLKILVSKNLEVYHVKLSQKDTVERLHISNILKVVKAENKKVNPKVFSVTKTTWRSYVSSKNDIKAFSRGEREASETVRETLVTAMDLGASDIHIRNRGYEASEIVLRVNQVIRPYLSGLDKVTVQQIVRGMWNTLKLEGDVSSDLDVGVISDTSSVYSHPVTDEKYMIRLNLIPEKRGEKVVARLRSTEKLMDIKDMGYMSTQLTLIKELSQLRSGVFVVTGPTNSGKSTTLTDLMRKIPPLYVVVEIADPIEVLLPGVEHFEAKPEKMEEYLSALMRQDPDYAVLGEIRNKVTVDAATKLAFSGISVWSTLHNADIPGAALRLKELGLREETLQNKLFLQGVVSQNLVQTICENCCSKIPLSFGLSRAEAIEKAKANVDLFSSANVRYWNPKGCDQCDGGFTGLTLVAEAVRFNDTIRKYIRNAEYEMIHEYMRESSIPTKHIHAGLKISDGLIDPILTEVRTDQFTKENLKNLHSYRSQY